MTPPSPRPNLPVRRPSPHNPHETIIKDYYSPSPTHISSRAASNNAWNIIHNCRCSSGSGGGGKSCPDYGGGPRSTSGGGDDGCKHYSCCYSRQFFASFPRDERIDLVDGCSMSSSSALSTNTTLSDRISLAYSAPFA